MKTVDLFAALDAQQAAVLAALDHALALAAVGPPEAVRTDLAKARWDLVRRARQYQLFKHTEIFDPGILRGTPAQGDAARQMKDACLAAGAALEEYAVHWTGKDLVVEWPSYRAALDRIAAALRGHIARERRAIVAFLAGAERTRKLSVAA